MYFVLMTIGYFFLILPKLTMYLIFVNKEMNYGILASKFMP